MGTDRRGRSLPAPLLRFAPAILVAALSLVLFPVPGGVALQGLIVGLVGALVAVGMSLLYRANRILNFAEADLGAAPAIFVVSLVVYGGMNYLLAISIGLIGALILGTAVELVVIRRFFRSPRLILTVATIGLAQLLATASLVIPDLWGKTPQTVQLHVPWDLHFSVDPLIFSADHVVALIVAPIVLFGLAALLRFTDAGVAIRGSADRADRARQLGVPVGRLQTVVWATAALLSFTGLILRAGILGLGVGTALSLSALLAALAALVLGRMSDLPAVTLSAVSLGLLEAGVRWNYPRSPGLFEPVLAVVIVACLLLRRAGQSRLVQDRTSTWRLAEDVRPVPRDLAALAGVRAVRWGAAVLAATFVVVLPHLLGPGDREKATAVVVFVIVTLSLVVLTGWAGQVSLGQMSFAAFGAATGAYATQHVHLDLSLALLVAAIIGAAVAVVVGLPALRVRGLFLAVTTLAFALTTSSYLLVPSRFSWVPVSRVERPDLFGAINLNSQIAYYYFCLTVTVLVALAVVGIRRSRTGRALRALRENEQATQAFGVDPAMAKLTAFGISGAMAAIAGCLLVHLLHSFSAATFAPQESFVAFTAAVVGGLGSMLGAVLGAIFLKGGGWFLPGARWQALTTAVGVLVVLWVLPGGLGAVVYGAARDRWLAYVQRKRLAPAPEPDGVVDLRETGGAGITVERKRRGHRPAARPTPVLTCKDVEVSYGQTQVLFGVDLEVGAGELVALLGTNGAGKSTLVKAISGLMPARKGAVSLNGVDITHLAADKIAARGITTVPGGEGVFPSLTVAENLRLAGWIGRYDRAAAAQRTEQVLAWFPALASRLDDAAADLSGGQQQMLSLSMALLSRPRVLLIDELDLGLAPIVVAQLVPIIKEIRDQGTAVILVEQSVHLALELAETAYFMEKGRIRFRGPTAELAQRPDLLRAVFLGGATASSTTQTAQPYSMVPTMATNGAPLLRVEEVAVRFGGIRAVDDVSLTVERGEIVGLIGPNGAGKTTLFDLVCGFTSASSGRILLDGREISGASPDQRARLGIGRSFQDASLFPSMTTEETIAVALERWTRVKDPLRPALHLPSAFDSEEAVQARVDELLDMLGLEQFRSTFVRELSTGTKRVLDLACTLAHKPDVMLLDEPSAGLSQREAESLQPLLFMMRDELGAALLVIEHDTALITAVSDRIVAMDVGRVIADDRPERVMHDPAVLSSYLGAGTDAVPAEVL